MLPAEEKIHKLKEMYKNCVLCPRACRVDRTRGELGYCRLPDRIIVDCALAHHGEEPPLSGQRGAGTIFHVSCNLGCIYCQNYQISQTVSGQILSVEQMAEVMLDLQNRGCHNVEPVTPTPQTPLIMEALVLARARGLKVPFVYNCGGYENPDVIKMLDGLVEIYLPDFKYGMEDVAVEYSTAPGYPVFALDSLKEMVRQVGDELETENSVAKKGVIVRHLVLPGKIENSKEVFKLIKKEISVNVTISLMSQYSPTPRVRCYTLLSRRITGDEYRQVLDCALQLGFKNLFIQEVNEYRLTPDFDREKPFD